MFNKNFNEIITSHFFLLKLNIKKKKKKKNNFFKKKHIILKKSKKKIKNAEKI